MAAPACGLALDRRRDQCLAGRPGACCADPTTTPPRRSRKDPPGAWNPAPPTRQSDTDPAHQPEIMIKLQDCSLPAKIVRPAKNPGLALGRCDHHRPRPALRPARPLTTSHRPMTDDTAHRPPAVPGSALPVHHPDPDQHQQRHPKIIVRPLRNMEASTSHAHHSASLAPGDRQLA